MQLEIKQYTKEDFLEGTAPYEDLYRHIKNKFLLQSLIVKMCEMAKSQGFNNFKKKFQSYVEMQKQQQNENYSSNVTEFAGQTMELNSGDWCCDELGVSINTPFGEQYACKHPLMPIERLVNIDTNIEKLKLAYKRGCKWKHLIADKKTLASSNLIVGLSDFGIGVTSENAKLMVRYLSDIEEANYDYIPIKNSVTRLGWIDGEGFVPYCKDLVFDGDNNLRTAFESVTKKGSREVWIDTVKKVITKNITARIILSASFASVLVKPLSILPFFVHLWADTEVGKTVGLMLAASVWANPEVGKYIKTFNATNVGLERFAAFANSLPLILDELEIVKDKSIFDKEIYLLCEGAGKSRGNKNGGIDNIPTWANCILTSGEKPIVTSASGGGAANRILEIECKEPLFENPREFSQVIKKNYGFAGEEFVKKIQENGVLKDVSNKFDIFLEELSKSDTTQKQAISASLILIADKIVNDLFFNIKELTAYDIKSFLQTKASISVHARAYNHFCDWVSQNANKFKEKDDIESFGAIKEDCVYIINSVFQRECNNQGFSYAAFLSYLNKNDLLEGGKDKSTKPCRINGVMARCVVLKMPKDELPF